jgi:ATP phosphoribosyltransferase
MSLTIAIAKGRLQQPVLDLLASAGIHLDPQALSSRRLTLENDSGDYRFLFVKPADVPIYVEHGIADCGVLGRDIFLESATDVLQPISLEVGRCQIVVAAPSGASSLNGGVVRVATKYPRITAAHFGSKGVAVEVIPLTGSVEIAPVLGLADCIVDLVETGRTLRENGLEIVEVIAESKACLVVNRTSYHFKATIIFQLIQLLKNQTKGGAGC